MMNKIITYMCWTILVVGLASCGGGGGASSPTGVVNSSVKQLTGVVVDGYLQGATAFVDRNNNGVLDAGEPSAITAADGTFSISLKAGDENYPVVVDIPPTAVDGDTGKPVGKHSVMNTPAPKTLKKVVVSPVTTMIKTVMDNSPNADLNAAVQHVKNQLKLTPGSNIDLMADYVAAKQTGSVNAGDYAKVHKVAQVVARAVANQVDAVKAAAQKSNPNATLADVVSLITAQVVNQLSSIDTTVSSSVGAWTPTKADNIAVTGTVSVDTYSAAFATAVTTQVNSTLAAAKTATAAADLANTKAQAALKLAQQVLAQAQQLQDLYSAAISPYTYALASAASTAALADPYASAAAKAAAASAVTVAGIPVITLKGNSTMNVALGSVFKDPGSTVVDNKDVNLKANVTGTVNANKLGSYVLLYDVTDSNGNKANAVTRTVIIIKDTIAPVIAYAGVKNVNLALGQAYVTPSVSVTDNIDKNLIAIITGSVNVNVVGVYNITYNITDSSGNKAMPLVIRVNVSDQTAPTITLTGGANINVVQGTVFKDPGAVVTDNVSKGLKASVTGAVNTAVIATYTLTYNVKDAAGNAATAVKRTVNVIAKPVGVTLMLYDDSKIQNGSFPIKAANVQTFISKHAIAGAKVVVDNGGPAKTYTTDAAGKVTIPGLDVGLHDVSLFADGFIWQSVYQVTFDPTRKNQFGLTANKANGFNNGGGNSQITLAVNLPTAKPLQNTVVELAITDPYTNMVYSTNVYQRWNNATPTNSNIADFYINQTDPYTTISGVMTAREISCDIYGMNCNETNKAVLGNVSYTTKPWTGTTQPPIGTVNVVYSATHVTVPAISPNPQPTIGVNITNSYAAPGTVIAPNTWPQVNLDFTYTDSYGVARGASGWVNVQTQGVFDAYGAYIGQKVAQGPAQMNVWFEPDVNGNTPAVGVSISARVLATESIYDTQLGSEVTINFVDLGLQTFTLKSGPYPGFPAQPLPASMVVSQMNVAFPATPPAQTTVLSIQSVVPPTGVQLSNGMGVDNWSTTFGTGNYYQRYLNQPVLPYTFKSFRPLTGDMTFYINGSDPYTGAAWSYDVRKPVGSIISYASPITSPISISPNQKGNVIAIQSLNNGGPLISGNGTIMMYDVYTQTQLWNIAFSPATTSITLTTPPAGILNPLKKGSSYLMDVQTTVLTGTGAPLNMSAFMYLMVESIVSRPNLGMGNYTVPNIPYQY